MFRFNTDLLPRYVSADMFILFKSGWSINSYCECKEKKNQDAYLNFSESWINGKIIISYMKSATLQCTCHKLFIQQSMIIIMWY